jgi:hypothetical protein
MKLTSQLNIILLSTVIAIFSSIDSSAINFAAGGIYSLHSDSEGNNVINNDYMTREEEEYYSRDITSIKLNNNIETFADKVRRAEAAGDDKKLEDLRVRMKAVNISPDRFSVYNSAAPNSGTSRDNDFSPNKGVMIFENNIYKTRSKNLHSKAREKLFDLKYIKTDKGDNETKTYSYSTNKQGVTGENLETNNLKDENLIKFANSGKFIGEMANHQDHVNAALYRHLRETKNLNKTAYSPYTASAGISGGEKSGSLDNIWAKIFGSLARKTGSVFNPVDHNSKLFGGIIGFDTKPGSSGISYGASVNVSNSSLLLTEEEGADTNIINAGISGIINYEITDYLSVYSLTGVSGHYLTSNADSPDKPEYGYGVSGREEIGISLTKDIGNLQSISSLAGFIEGHSNSNISQENIKEVTSNHKKAKNYAKAGIKLEQELGFTITSGSSINAMPYGVFGVSFSGINSEKNNENIISLNNGTAYLLDSFVQEEKYIASAGAGVNVDKPDMLAIRSEYRYSFAKSNYHSHFFTLKINLKL